MKNPTIYRYFVGIDVSKLVLDVCMEDARTGQRYAIQVNNTPKGFAELDDWLVDGAAVPRYTVLCSEHTGRYGEHLARWAGDSQWEFALVKTTASNTVGQEHHRKTDAYDAQLLAEYARRYTDKLSLHTPDAQPLVQLQRLRRERRYMVDQRASLKQKLRESGYHAANMDQINQMYSQQVELLDEQIAWIEERIHQLIQHHESLHHCYQRIRTAPGIGKVIGSLWLSLFAGQQTLNPRKISSRFGFAPHEYSSGSTVRRNPKSAGFGNTEMRRLMHQAARSVAHHHPHFRGYYQRKLTEGKDEKLIINNIINKIIRTVCAMWNTKTDYDPNYIHKMKKIHQTA